MITLSQMRETVKRNLPYDTGFMYMFGNRFNETEFYVLCYYDSTAVPYIVHNERGHNNNPNKGFISIKTVDALNSIVANNGVVSLQEAERVNQDRAQSVSQGVMEYLRTYQKASGLTYEHYASAFK